MQYAAQLCVIFAVSILPLKNPHFLLFPFLTFIYLPSFPPAPFEPPFCSCLYQSNPPKTNTRNIFTNLSKAVVTINEINLTWLDFLCRYLRCCPACRSLRRTRESFKSIVFYNLQNMSSFFKRKSPRLVMFGPGLESDTKGLVRQLLWDSTSPFEVTGMFPGQFDGIYRLFFICISNPERCLSQYF